MTTDYHDTFIAVAPDCPVDAAVEPPPGATPTVARMQYDMLAAAPYRYTSDDVIFAVHARRKGIPPERWDEERDRFFSRSQACLRASPLSKRYGWGTHHDSEGRVALVGLGTPEYERLVADPGLEHRAAMRSSRSG